MWAMSIGHKSVLIATMAGMSGVSIIAFIKFLIDRSRDAIEREDKKTKQRALKQSLPNH